MLKYNKQFNEKYLLSNLISTKFKKPPQRTKLEPMRNNCN